MMNELEVSQSRLFHRRHSRRPTNQTDIHTTQFAVILASTDSLARHQPIGFHDSSPNVGMAETQSWFL
jgi:hypothetical protein